MHDLRDKNPYLTKFDSITREDEFMAVVIRNRPEQYEAIDDYTAVVSQRTHQTRPRSVGASRPSRPGNYRRKSRNRYDSEEDDSDLDEERDDGEEHVPAGHIIDEAPQVVTINPAITGINTQDLMAMLPPNKRPKLSESMNELIALPLSSRVCLMQAAALAAPSFAKKMSESEQVDNSQNQKPSFSVTVDAGRNPPAADALVSSLMADAVTMDPTLSSKQLAMPHGMIPVTHPTPSVALVPSGNTTTADDEFACGFKFLFSVDAFRL